MITVFRVRRERDGGFSASSFGSSIFTQGDSVDDLLANCFDALSLHRRGEFALVDAEYVISRLYEQKPGDSAQLLDFRAFSHLVEPPPVEKVAKKKRKKKKKIKKK